MITRKTIARIWTMFGLCALGWYITACDNEELSGNEHAQANTDLRFTASISDSPFTKATNEANIIEGLAFPDGEHLFGMFITNGAGEAVVTGSNDNMISTLTRGGASDTWTHANKNGQELSLKANHGENINITGYYPWTENAAANSVPFDLTGEPSTWTDLLYLSSPAEAQQVTDGTIIPLTFSHAFCWVTIKLSKLTDKSDVVVTAVSIENSHDKLERIMTKGNMNSKTGNVEGTTFGPLVIGCNPNVNLPENGYTPAEFNFLVPPFMNTDVQDSDIVIRVTTETSGNREVLSFPLRKTHLNNANTNQYGFEKGKHNTYNIIYNNSEMLLSLSDWQEAVIGETKLGEGTAGVEPQKVKFQNYFTDKTGVDKNILTVHVNHTYLGEVSNKSNGEYRKFEILKVGNMFDIWEPAMKAEPFYPQLMVARNNAAGNAQVPWKDENTEILMAQQACLEFREGGFKDWRLPRISEFYSMVYPTNAVEGGKYVNFWTGTEYDSDHSYVASFSTTTSIRLHYPQKASKKEAFYVRCVRDADKPKPTI